MNNFSVSIFTPSGVVIDRLESESLTVPTSSGIVNILKGHTHLITELDTGLLQVNTASGETRHFTIAGGLFKLLGSEVKVLAKTSESPESIDVERAQAARRKAEEKLQAALPTLASIKYRRKLDRAKARIKLANLK